MVDPGEWAELDAQDEAVFERSPREWFLWAVRFDRQSRRRIIVRLINRIGEFPMARGVKKSAQAAGSGKTAWTVFVDVPIDPDAWDDVMQSFGSGDALIEAVTEIVSSGHRLSISYNGQNDSFTVSITGKGEGCVNDGKTLTSFASTWYVALQVACYKHLVIAEGDWTGASVVAQRPPFG